MGSSKTSAESALQRAREKRDQKQTALNTARQQHAKAKTEVQTSKSAHRALVDERIEQENLVKEKSDAVFQNKSEFESVNNALRTANRNHAQTESKLKVTQNKLTRTKTQLTATENDLQRNQDELTQSRQKREDLTSNSDALTTKIQRYERDMEDHRIQIRDKQTELDNVTTEHQKQIIIVQRLKTQNENIKQKLIEKTNAEKVTDRELTNQKTLLQAAEKSAAQLREDITKNNDLLTKVQHELTVKTKELQTVTGQIKTIINQTSALEQRQTNTRQQLNECQTDYQIAHRQVQSQSDKLQELTQKRDTYTIHFEKIQGEVKQVESKLQMKKEELQKNQDTIKVVTDSLRLVGEKKTQCCQTIDTRKNQLVSLNSSVQEKTQQIKNHERHLRQVGNEIRNVEDRFVGNENLRKETYEKMEELEKTITKLNQYYCSEKVKLEMKAAEIMKQQPKNLIEQRNPMTNVVSNEQKLKKPN
jgi:chromosome segregation ATPase